MSLGREGTRLPLAHWGLSADADDGLRLGGRSLTSLAERFGTPFYLFDEARLESNARSCLQTARDALGPETEVYYSLKTNPFPGVLPILERQGLGAEVISRRELEAAAAAGWAGERVVFNGPGKSPRDLEAALDLGARVQVESASEARDLARLAATTSAGRRARAGIRINPDVADPEAPQGLRMGARGTVFGLDPEGQGFAAALEALSGDETVALESLSGHIGTGILTSGPHRRLVRALARVWRRLAAGGVEVPVLDLGGGFSVPSEVRLPGASPEDPPPAGDRRVPAPEAIAPFAEICQAIADELAPAGVTARVALEPGRLLVADCFHLVTRVVRLKEEGGALFAVLDASRFQSGAFVPRGYHEILHLRRPLATPERPVTLSGPLCVAFDLFARELPLPRLEEGDPLVILDVGAYNLSAQSAWSFPPAPVVTLGEGGAVGLAAAGPVEAGSARGASSRGPGAGA